MKIKKTLRNFGLKNLILLIGIFSFSLGLTIISTRSGYFGPQIKKANNTTIIETTQKTTQNQPMAKMTYGHFLEYIKMGWVNSVDFYDDNHFVIVEASSPELGNRTQRIRVEIPINAAEQLVDTLKMNNIDIDAHKPVGVRPSKTLSLLGIAFITPIFVLGIRKYLQLRKKEINNNNNNNNSRSRIFTLGKVQKNFNMELNTNIQFKDVAGIEEAKEDFKEIVDFLKTPEKFIAMGAQIPRGVLLVGPPGTGKTLLAKAIAGEAGVPFLSLSGSEFIELFVGVGASRVRDAFRQAKKNAPCIIFIDEIDTVGRQRGAGIGGGNDEREQTLNQLLTELDGFEGNSGIILIAATNRLDVLDTALLRPGRFDRQITINLPDIKGRLAILKVHARNKKFESNVSLESLAKRTTGFSGANLKNVLNEAAILAARTREPGITRQHIDSAVERIIAGLENDAVADLKNKRLTAYHEAGHAIVASLLKYHDPVEKLTIIPRGQAGGLTWFTPGEDQGLISQKQILARITGALGGRAAEKVIFGNSEVTTGASSDIIQLTSMAKQLVTRYGMSKLGPQAFDTGNRTVFVDGNFTNQSKISQETAEKIDEAVKEIINSCENEACRLIRQHKITMSKVVETLLENENMTGEEFRSILNKEKEIAKINPTWKNFSLKNKYIPIKQKNTV